MPKSRLPRNQVARNQNPMPRGISQPWERQNLTYQQKIEVIDFYHNTRHYLKLVQMVDHLRERGFETLHPSTISRYVRDEALIRERAASSSNSHLLKHCRSVQLPEIDKALYQWILGFIGRNGRVGDYHIISKARELCQTAGIPDDEALEFSRGWLTRFKKRHGLRRIQFHGERVSVPIENIEPEQACLQTIIAQYEPRDVFNIDETGLNWRMPPRSGIADYDRGGLKDDWTRLSYALCANLDGSEKRRPFVIGYAVKPHCFGGLTPSQCGYDYHSNSMAYMRGDLWQELLTDLDKDMRQQNQHILLICDNCAGRMHNDSDYSNVRIEFLAPNLTAYIQPLDAGVIAAFKTHYRWEYLKLVIRRDTAGITNIYKIDQRQAMQLADAAWAAVSSETIANCWRHTGICPTLSSPEGEYTPTGPEDPETVRQELLRQIGLDEGRMQLDVHPDVYRMVDVLSREVQTEEQPTEEQLLQAVRTHHD